MRSTSAATLLETGLGRQRLSFGCPILNGAFGGRGIHGGVTEISGEAGCGKTQLCLQLALQCARPVSEGGLDGSTAYMSCGEGEFPLKRLVQLSRSCVFADNKTPDAPASNGGEVDSSQVLSRIHIEQCRSPEEAMETLVRTVPTRSIDTQAIECWLYRWKLSP
jgi:RecA/RadA recombinase